MKKGFIDGLLDSLDCTLSSTFQNLSYKEGLKICENTYSSLNRCFLYHKHLGLGNI